VIKKILSKLPFVKKKESLLFTLLGYHTNKEIYKKALIHKSYNCKNHNEQLEFLGDAILSSVVAERLFLENPNKEEGFLSQKRAIIVSRKHLNIVGRKIIPEKKIKSNLKKTPPSVFGNTLEAIIGAIYIDKGKEKAKLFIEKNIYNSIFLEELLNLDFKSKLLKHSQKNNTELVYKLEKQVGLSHQKEFLVSVFLNSKKIASATGKTKKEAEQGAAKKAIKIAF
jgi:ribonuclease-3